MFRIKLLPTKVGLAITRISSKITVETFGDNRFWLLEDHQLLAELYFKPQGCTLYLAINCYSIMAATLALGLCARYSNVELSTESVCFNDRGVPIYGDDAVYFYEDLDRRILTH